MNNSPVLRSLRGTFREAVAGHPDLWRFVSRIRSATHDMVGPDTDLVCEGYQRSGNSFAEAALKITQGDILIAHHRHVAAQLLYAVRGGMPALLLIRDPRDAVASAVLRRSGETALGRELASWINFNRAVLPVADQLIVSDFPVTTGDFTSVIDALSERYPDRFTPATSTSQELSTLAYAEIRRIAEARGRTAFLNYGPGLDSEAKAQRAAALDDLRARLDRQHAAHLTQAREIYQTLRAQSVGTTGRVGDTL